MVTVVFVDVEHNWTNQCTTFLMTLLTFTLWISFAQETRSSILVLRFFSHYWCSEKLQRDRVPAWADFFFWSLYHADATDWIKVTWRTASYVCLHWRCVSECRHACMLPCHIIGVSFECDIFFCFFHCGVYMHKNPAYERMKLSLSLCLWTPNTTIACWFVLHMQTILTGWVSGEGSNWIMFQKTQFFVGYILGG